MGSIWMRPNGGLSSSGTQNMQSSTGQYSTQAGDPAQPVQHSVITASSFGFFLRAVEIPFERGSNFWSSGTIPGALTTSGAFAISSDSTFPVKPPVKQLPAWFFRRSRACYNARAIRFIFDRTHVHQAICQTSSTGFAGRTRIAPLLRLAFPLLFRRYPLLRRACPQLAVPRCLRLLLPRATSSLGCARAGLPGIPGRDLFPGWHGTASRHARPSVCRSCDVRFGRGHRRSPGPGRSRRDSQPRCSGCALAYCSLSVHRQLRGRAADGSAGNIFRHVRSFDFSVAGGNDARSHHVEWRYSSRRKNLVRGRTCCWSRHTRSAGNAAAAGGRTDRALAALSPPRELENTDARNAVDDCRIVAAAGALGCAQCGQCWPRAISRAALRGDGWRCSANRLLRVDENLDVSFSRRVSFHLENAFAADRCEKSSFIRSGFYRRIVTRRFPAGSLQSHARNDALTRSRIRSARAGTHAASSDSYLCMDPARARRRNVVYSADYSAAVLRKTLAAERKLSQQSHRFRSHSRLGVAQYSVRWNGSCRRVVGSHEFWSLADRGVHHRSHRISHAIANLRAALCAGLIPCTSGRGRATFPPREHQLAALERFHSHCTFTETSVFWFAAICTLSPSAIYFCRTLGSAHSKSQPSSIAMSVYRPGTTTFSAKVPSESD